MTRQVFIVVIVCLVIGMNGMGRDAEAGGIILCLH
jgi:hypothetical protein